MLKYRHREISKCRAIGVSTIDVYPAFSRIILIPRALLVNPVRGLGYTSYTALSKMPILKCVGVEISEALCVRNDNINIIEISTIEIWSYPFVCVCFFFCLCRL